MTGLGQSIAYLKKADASYLVSPSQINGFDMSGYLKDLFNKFIIGKLPIGLVVFDGQDLNNIRLECDIDSSLRKDPKAPYRGSKASFWAIWRDLSHFGIYKFLVSAQNIQDNSMQRADKVWDYFFDNYYAPNNTRVNIFEPIPNAIYKFGLENNMIPFEDIKEYGLKIKEEGLLYEDILKDHRDEYLTGINNKNSPEKNARIFIENKSWSKNINENIYENYEKNFRNFVRHSKLLAENYVLTEIGRRFMERCDKVLWNPNNYLNNNSLLNDELACVLLVAGKHHNLILDIIEISKGIKKISEDDQYLIDLYKSFDSKGYIAKNSNRTITGSRKFLQAEKQIWGHLDLINKSGRGYFTPNIGYQFNIKRIESLINKYYETYSDVDDQLEIDKSEVLLVA